MTDALVAFSADPSAWTLALAASAVVFGGLVVVWWAVMVRYGGPGGSTDDA